MKFITALCVLFFSATVFAESRSNRCHAFGQEYMAGQSITVQFREDVDALYKMYRDGGLSKKEATRTAENNPRTFHVFTCALAMTIASTESEPFLIATKVNWVAGSLKFDHAEDALIKLSLRSMSSMTDKSNLTGK